MKQFREVSLSSEKNGFNILKVCPWDVLNQSLLYVLGGQ